MDKSSIVTVKDRLDKAARKMAALEKENAELRKRIEDMEKKFEQWIIYYSTKNFNESR